MSCVPSKMKSVTGQAVCAIEDCDRTTQARGLCSKHYHRLRRRGELEVIRPQRKSCGICIIEGCDSVDMGPHGWCFSHYGRFKRHGDPLKGEPSPRKSRGICIIEGCDTIDSGPHGLCQKHHYRVEKHGDPHVTVLGGNDIGYCGVHDRLTARYGPARDYSCIDCGHRADHWSYDNDDPDSKIEHGMVYSVKLECYSPRCASCHKLFDLSQSHVSHGMIELSRGVEHGI